MLLGRWGKGVDFLGRKGEKCLIRRSGPMVLIWKVERASAWEMAEGDFSGCRIPGMQNARRSGVLGKRDLQWAAATEIVSSSVVGEVSLVFLE